MPQIRHTGITTRDPAATAELLVKAFDMTEVERGG
jgi:hypothetical protein